MEVALEPPALGVARFDDAGREERRSSSWADLGLQTLVLEREPGRRRDFLDELGVVERGAPWTSTATVRPSRTSGVAARLPSGRRRLGAHRRHVTALADWVGDLELGVAERSSERLP